MKPRIPIPRSRRGRLALLAAEALFDFFRNLSPDTTWEATFEESFGMSVETFYADFAAWRAREAPYPQAFYSGVVVGPDGTPVEGVWINAAWRRSPLDAHGNPRSRYRVEQDVTGEMGHSAPLPSQTTRQ